MYFFGKKSKGLVFGLNRAMLARHRDIRFDASSSELHLQSR